MSGDQSDTGGTQGGAPSKNRKKSGSKSAAWWISKIGTVAALGIMALGIVIRVIDPEPIEALRLKTFDLYNRLEPRPSLSREQTPVAIVDIDEKSLAELGQWPWPRTVLADLLAALRDQGAVVAGFDMVFAEPDRTSPGRIAESIRGADPETVEQLRALPSNDAVMASVMRTFRTVVGQAGTKTEAVEKPSELALSTTFKGVRAVQGADSKLFDSHVFTQTSLVANIEDLEQSAFGRGLFSVEEEVDGVVRRVPILMKVEGAIKPTLTVEMLRVAFQGNSIFAFMNQGGIQDVRLQTTQGAYQIPVDGKGRVWVYFSEPDRFNTPDNSGRLYVSASDVINNKLPTGRLAGKLILIGTSAVGLLDIRSTPIYSRLPGIEVHANLLETILTNNFIKYPVEMAGFEMIGMILAGIIMILLIPRVGPIWTLLGLLAAAGTLVGGSWYMFTEKKTLIDVTYSGILVFATYFVLTFTNYMRDAVEKRQVRGAFSQYLSPDLVEQLAENPDQLTLGGELKRMTLLFCDVRGFTTISESFKDDPQGLTKLINRLLTPLTNEILKRRGTIDKYMGDCIMAFWNAPLEDEKQEVHACDAALAMFKALDVLNAEREAEAKEQGVEFLPLKIGAGINTGDCVVGNMGSDQRFDYSVLGDSVNLASRLEGQSKSYGVDVVLGVETQSKVTDQFATAELDLIAVKGKTEAVRIFALLDQRENLDPAEFKAFEEKHTQFLELYRAQNWDEAEKLGEQNKARLGGKMAKFYEIYRQRMEEFRSSPLPADWDGVYVATTK
ncbi:CHASE2 domain-containing protein [Aestuariispira insulae]|uniref:Adenylate cyclase n=1 Tax=Aestuariispira insulae TaxID=1461337 RepID=A0A3D9HN87_9PROT|nr:adenylate/guanylate cyclase domain-containing protein [Aestuariispira insulae]RED50963.1 adenylate cyclase [Aestuariispira insulae]